MKAKILVVEDDPHILLGLEEVLKSDNFDVATCNRGNQALDAVAKHRPALVLAPQAASGALAALDVTFEPRRASPTLMADPGLEAIRAGVPAARSLPLLAALARGAPAQVVVEYRSAHLSVRVTPC